jgi:hypothetical protein
VNQVVTKQFCQRQQMQWRKGGAHLLLQRRVKTLNRELGYVFKRWYPDMAAEDLPDAANPQHLPALPEQEEAQVA